MRRAVCGAGNSSDVRLALASTVHKAQGGGFAHVVFALGHDAFRMRIRCLVYTAVGRARDTLTLVELVWEEGAMKKAARNAGDVRWYERLA